MNNCVIIIPAYNPKLVLIQIVNDLLNAGFEHIVCINDGSGVEYQQIFASLSEIQGVELVEHATNLGKGRALKTAFNYVCTHHSDDISCVITMDADGQHTVESVLKLYHAHDESNQMLLGSRNFSGNDVKIPLRSKIGNIITRQVFRFLCNINVSDTQTGLRLYPLSVLPGMLKVSGEKYEYETNCLLYCKDNGLMMREIEIETVYEDKNSSSHFNPLTDSIKIYAIIFKYTCASLLSVVIDYFVFYIVSLVSSNVFLMTYCARAVSSIFNFLVNKNVVFKGDKDKSLHQALGYFVLLVVSGTISAALISVLNKAFSVNLLILKMIVETILFFFNFYIQKNYIFKKKNSGNK